MAKKKTSSRKITNQETQPGFSWKVFHIWVACFIVIYLCMFFFTDIYSEMNLGEGLQGFIFKVLASIIASYFLSLTIYGPYVLIKKLFRFGNEINKISTKTDQLQEDLSGDFFNNLVKLNFKYLDKYYLQTQVQADKSFLLSTFAALVGLFILTVGIVMMYKGETTPAYVTTAAGAFSEFIAAVFFYLYNQTVIKMSEYHQKLVLTQNIGLSLKISQGLPDEQRVKTQSALIDSLTKDINQHLSGVLITK